MVPKQKGYPRKVLEASPQSAVRRSWSQIQVWVEIKVEVEYILSFPEFMAVWVGPRSEVVCLGRRRYSSNCKEPLVRVIILIYNPYLFQ